MLDLRKRGFAPLITFERTYGQNGSTYIPPRATYTDAVKAFVTQFPYVRLYTAWNEPGMKPAIDPVIRIRP